ncbi:MAG: DUF4956 domain-containing protein [Alphaproteobacteria bacterium]
MLEKLHPKLGSPIVIKLLGRLTLYYLLIFGLLIALVELFPGAKDMLPFGGASFLANPTGANSFEDLSGYLGFNTDSIKTSLKLFFSIIGVLLVMLPVTWVYLKVRLTSKLDQSLVQTMLILPIAVAGVVAIVQNSLALAFSLAGIVAGVRFRNTLKNTGDSLFIFTAIGAGLAAGVGALEIAVVVTLVFNYLFLILWDLDYGAENAEKYMNPSDTEEDLKKMAAKANRSSGSKKV